MGEIPGRTFATHVLHDLGRNCFFWKATKRHPGRNFGIIILASMEDTPENLWKKTGSTPAETLGGLLVEIPETILRSSGIFEKILKKFGKMGANPGILRTL